VIIVFLHHIPHSGLYTLPLGYPSTQSSTLLLVSSFLYTILWAQVSQGSAATDLRWGENFNKFLFRNSLLYIALKKLWKLVNICQSYHKN